MSKIYLSKNRKTGEEELYRAENQSKAFAHIAAVFEVKMASQDDLERLLTAGVKVQEITKGNEQ